MNATMGSPARHASCSHAIARAESITVAPLLPTAADPLLGALRAAHNGQPLPDSRTTSTSSTDTETVSSDTGQRSGYRGGSLPPEAAEAGATGHSAPSAR